MVFAARASTIKIGERNKQIRGQNLARALFICFYTKSRLSLPGDRTIATSSGQILSALSCTSTVRYCGFVQDNEGAVPFPGSLIEHVKVKVRAVETDALSDNIAAELVTEPPELLTATENEAPVVMTGVV